MLYIFYYGLSSGMPGESMGVKKQTDFTGPSAPVKVCICPSTPYLVSSVAAAHRRFGGNTSVWNRRTPCPRNRMAHTYDFRQRMRSSRWAAPADCKPHQSYCPRIALWLWIAPQSWSLLKTRSFILPAFPAWEHRNKIGLRGRFFADDFPALERIHNAIDV